MNEEELNKKLDRLIEMLCTEDDALNFSELNLQKKTYDEKRKIFYDLCIIRNKGTLDYEFLKIQNELLSYETKKKQLTDIASLEFKKNIALFVGNITTIRADAIVCPIRDNIVGSYNPKDTSITNTILSAGGLQIRQELGYIKSTQMQRNITGLTKIIKGYNLPSKYVIYTASPVVVGGRVGYKEKESLVNCYKSCLDLAYEKGLNSIVFSCISTGKKQYPKALASEIAVSTVVKWLKLKNYPLKVVFCLFDSESKKYYETNFVDYDVR